MVIALLAVPTQSPAQFIFADVGLASLVGNRAALWFDYDGDLDLPVVCDASSGCLDSAMLTFIGNFRTARSKM